MGFGDSDSSNINMIFNVINLVIGLTALTLSIYVIFKLSDIKSDVAKSIAAMHANMLKIVDEIDHVNKVEFELDQRQEQDIVALKHKYAASATQAA